MEPMPNNARLKTFFTCGWFEYQSAMTPPRQRGVEEARLWILRSALLTGCVIAGAIAAWNTHPARYFAEDAALARLLRGMAVLKGFAVLAALTALFWRLGRRMTLPVAAGYFLSMWTMAAATCLIWQLDRIPLAAVAFHAALVGLLLTAWRDDIGRLPLAH